MSLDERRALEALKEGNNTTILDWQDCDDFSFGDVCNGTEPLAISHAGGEFTDLAREVLGDFWRITALVHQGLMPCSPISPTVGITTEALDLYRVAHLRSPQLSIQAFVKTMCDLHGVGFHRHLSRQFFIAFDLYLQVQCSVAAMVAESLRRDSPDWRLKHACPACTYTLTDEPQLTFSLLYAMDGNDSLKRVLRRSLDTDDSLSTSSELPTGQQLASDRYLCDENTCEGRWKNMDDTKTKKAWGIYDETGIFVAVCRHGFSLLVADMVQSGELAKYPLAVVSKLLDVFGSNLGGGYDIGCQFKTTLDNSSLGPLARSMHHTCLVGAFHGHAHRRLCQLFSLTTYIKGLGLEDLETSSALRYASVFHRQQSIDTYFEHNDDFEVYANLSDFLYNNYKQALDILNDGDATLPNLMRDLKVTDKTVFEHWLEEEKVYLQGLTREPEVETLHMEYWQRLVSLTASEETLDAAITAFQGSSHLEAAPYDVQAKNTRNAESAQRHALEDHERYLKLVQALECRLEIEKRWTPHDAEWQRVGRLVANRKYQRVLDRLEGLIHIAKALQTRSVAIRTALNTYNAIAGSMHPPRRTLKWDEVVEYAFLADFDLLRDTRADVSRHPWSSAAAHSAMDLHFKMCRARKEIERLDTERYLRECENQLKDTSPALAHQIAIHRNTRGRFNSRHLKRLYDISKLPGFSGTLTPGVSADTSPGESASVANAQIPTQMLVAPLPVDHTASPLDVDTQDDLDDEEEEDELYDASRTSIRPVCAVLEFEFAFMLS
ncbi:hypothetical protein EDB19DRAFT_1989115 [Suillus lakei]|nr:hypothetical protein EDB19DRAFT_1989115 [Suillus lakei]